MREPRGCHAMDGETNMHIQKKSTKAESAEINSQHVPLRQTAEATGRGKGLEAVWDT
jgi:hypothetical protein